jgi:large subunit ribosomal protein L22
MKEYTSTQKFLVGSPRKLRAVVALIKKMKPLDAVINLPFAGRRAAGDLSKVVKSALANARNQGASETELIFKEIQIGEGPRLKRGNAASRGRWHPFKHRMSHIRVVLTTANRPQTTAKKEESETIVKAAKLETKKEMKIEKKSAKTKKGETS